MKWNVILDEIDAIHFRLCLYNNDDVDDDDGDDECSMLICVQ